jgi:hypothetical protein
MNIGMTQLGKQLEIPYSVENMAFLQCLVWKKKRGKFRSYFQLYRYCGRYDR